MAKEDFTLAEFASRLGRVRARMAERGLDWLIAIHPASIHWITGSDAKSYQEFQCLLIGAESQPLIVLTRQGEVNEFEACSIADEVQGFGGGETEYPIAAFATLARKHKLIGKRIGLEVPSFYLHPYHYLALRDLLGADRVSDASDLIADLKLVKSQVEIGYIRNAAALCDKGLERFIADLAPGRSSWRWPARSTRRCSPPTAASPRARSISSRVHARPSAMARRPSADLPWAISVTSNSAPPGNATPPPSAGNSCSAS